MCRGVDVQGCGEAWSGEAIMRARVSMPACVAGVSGETWSGESGELLVGKERSYSIQPKARQKSPSLFPCIDTLALKQRPDLASPGQLDRLEDRPCFLVLTQ